MKKQLLTIVAVSLFLMTACNQQAKQETTNNTSTEQTVATVDDIIKKSLTNKEGKKLDMVFDNSKNIVNITFEGETTTLTGQRAASGIWYKNDHYELRGKGNDVQLTKDGKVVFEHQDDKVEIVAKNEKGDVLNMTFNNTEGTVKAYLNGGEQIDLVQQRAASGIWYKNDHYELRGKADKYKLLKDDKTVFEN